MIQIDISMPKNCQECPLKIKIDNDVWGGYELICPYLINKGTKRSVPRSHRDSDCPLKEIENGRDSSIS